MKKKIRLTESQLVNIIKKTVKRMLNEDPSDYNFFSTHDSLKKLRDAMKNNRMVSVAYVKKDGTVRHMVVRSNLSSHVFSDAPKTEKQLNIQQNNDIKRVIDINVYNKTLRDLKNQGTPEDEAKTEASKKSWRTVNLKDVLGFLVDGEFVDLREENNIMERYGEEIYNSLTKGMIKSMAHEMEQG